MAYVNPDTAMTQPGTPVSGDVLSNDTGLLGLPTVVLNVTNAAGVVSTVLGTPISGTYGDLTINAEGLYTYTPGVTAAQIAAIAAAPAGTPPVDVFTYASVAGAGLLGSSTLSITIEPANSAATQDVPVLGGNTITGSSGTGGTGALGGDTTPQGGNLTVAGVSNADGTTGTVGQPLDGTYGQLTLNSDGSYTYAANNAAAIAAAPVGVLTDTFSYSVDDGEGNVSTQTMTMDVVGPRMTTSEFATYQPLVDASAGYTVQVVDTAANIAADLPTLTADADHIGSITATDGPVAVSVATFQGDQAALDKVSGGFTVADTAGNVSSNLSSLLADQANIGSVVVSNGPLTVDAATFGSSQPILDKVSGGFDVADTSTNLVNALPSLQADQANIAAITSTDGPVVVTAAQFAADQDALDKIAQGFEVSDTAANITAHLDQLQADAQHITSITSTDTQVTVGVNKFVADQAALDKITGGFSMLAEVASNVATNLDAIEADYSAGHINSIAVAPSAGLVAVTAAQAVRDQSVLDAIGTYTVTDTAEDIVANLSALQADTDHIAAITATDPPVTVGVNMFLNDQTTLDKITGGFAIEAQVASNLLDHIDAVEADYNAGHITSISLAPSAGPLTVDVAQAIQYQNILDVIGTYSVSDTVDAISQDLPNLEADASHIGSITVTDGTVVVGVNKFLANQAALDKISGGFSMLAEVASNVSSSLDVIQADYTAGHISSIAVAPSAGTVTVAAAQVARDQSVLDAIGSYALNDTSGNIGRNLDMLQADDSHIAGITLTDSSPEISITADQASSDAGVLSKISTPYALQVANSDGSTTTTAEGENLTITPQASGNETFVFKPNFGQDTITDLASHLSDPAHDTVVLPSTEFANFAAVLNDAQAAGNGSIITAANGDSLALPNVSVATLENSAANFKFA